MAIKKTINGQSSKAMNKITVTGVKKNEQIIEPEAEEVVSVVELLDIEPSDETERVVNERPYMPSVIYPEFENFLENSQKINQERKFAKVALCIGIGFLVLMILNKK